MKAPAQGYETEPTEIMEIRIEEKDGLMFFTEQNALIIQAPAIAIEPETMQRIEHALFQELQGAHPLAIQMALDDFLSSFRRNQILVKMLDR